jgi:hypothetical protein
VVSHACFLINTDLFEFDGVNGVQRHRGVGRDPSYDWNRLGQKLNGTTYVSPEKLAGAISRANWSSSSYKVGSHNCHHFVQWCLDAVGAGFFYQDYNQMLLSLF